MSFSEVGEADRKARKSIIKTTIEHDNLKTEKYIDLAKKITITDHKTLDIISYHKTCYQKFTSDGIATGWKREGNSYFPETNNDDIAPLSVINLESCQCKHVIRCGCLMNGLMCIDFCNCGDTSENTYPPISFTDIKECDNMD